MLKGFLDRIMAPGSAFRTCGRHTLSRVSGAYNGIAWLVVPHAAILAWLLFRHIREDKAPGRIDGLMAASLGYVLWFRIVPLLNLALL